jgi:hypothetical protein
VLKEVENEMKTILAEVESVIEDEETEEDVISEVEGEEE